jgi:hypothetical protein
MPKRGLNKRVKYLFDYFDYNLFGIKLVNALRRGVRLPMVAISPSDEAQSPSLCSADCQGDF